MTKNKILKMTLNKQKKKRKEEMWYLLHKVSVLKKLKVCVRRCFVTLTLHTKTHSVGGS